MLKISTPLCFPLLIFNGRLHQQPIGGMQDRLAQEKIHHQPVGRLVLVPVAALVVVVAAVAAAGPQVLSYDSSAADCGNISGKPTRLRER